MAELREVVLKAIIEWDRSTSKGREPGSFVYLLTDAERADLAGRITAAVEAR